MVWGMFFLVWWGILFGGLPGHNSLYAQGAVNQKSTEKKQEVRIGYCGDEGFLYQTEDGNYAGYAVEYLEAISGYTNWDFQYIYGSWENNLKRLKKGELDFICNAPKTAEWETDYLYSKYFLGTESSMLYVRKDDDRYCYNEYESFDGMKVAVCQNSYQERTIQEDAKASGFRVRISVYQSKEECFAALRCKKVDGVSIGSLALQWNYKMVANYKPEPFYMIAEKKRDDLMEAVDLAVSEIKTEYPDFETTLYKKHFGKSLKETRVSYTRREQEYIDSGEEFHVAFIPNRKPLSYLDRDGNIIGIIPDIIKQMAKRGNLRCTYEMMPPGYTPMEFLKEHPDYFVAGINLANPAFVADSFLKSEEIYSDDVGLVCRIGEDYSIDAPDESYTLAFPKSYAALRSYIQEYYSQFEIIDEISTVDCMKAVLVGKADFAAQNVNVLTPLLSDPHYEGLTLLPTFFMEETMGIVCGNTEKNKLAMQILDKCIYVLQENEIDQFTIDHNVSNGYKASMGDLIYKVRYALLGMGVLLAGCICLLVAYLVLRKRSYLVLEKKNEQLASAVSQANNSNFAKSQFLARMSHEIRNPMNAVVGLTNIAKYHKNDSDKIEDYLNKIEVSSKILLNIINDVLDISAIESNKVKIAHSPFNLKDLIFSVSILYHTQCKEKGVVFVTDISQIRHKYLLGDELRVNQILLNLVSNAYKFTSQGKIELIVREVTEKEGKVYYNFQVSDTGEGMSQEMQDQLFQPFKQESEDISRKYGGSGLGLSIAKNLVEMMQGTITCKSEKGKGTSFTVFLPFERDLLTEQKYRETEEKIERAPREFYDAYKQYDFGGSKVLLAEDTVFSAEIVVELLEMVNIKVDLAGDGKQVVEAFKNSKENEYKAILMDIKMPVMDGYEAAREIRNSSHPCARTIPIIAMTANAFAEDVSNVLNAGMDSHIAKPIDAGNLFQMLGKWCGNHTKK